MNTQAKKTALITILTSSLLLGHWATNYAIDKLGIPTEEAIPLSPVGPEFQVNTYTEDNQTGPALAMDEDGNFVVVWESGDPPPTIGQDGDWEGIFAQRYDHSGAPIGVEFQVNTHTNLTQEDSAVAMNHSGAFVVVWDSKDQDGSGSGIYGQRYNKLGTPVGSEFQVNTVTPLTQAGPDVAMNVNGDFVIVWESNGQTGTYETFARRYNYSGQPLGAEFQVNTSTYGSQGFTRIAMNDSGAFVVVWRSTHGLDGDGHGVFGQLYDSLGNPDGPEFRINSTTIGDQTHPDVAMDADGNFIVIWVSYNPDIMGDPTLLFGQRYDFTGAPVGSEFQIASDIWGGYLPAVTMDDDRNAWASWTKDGAIFAQGFDPTGALIGTEFQVNSFAGSGQVSPRIVINNNGHAVVAWYGSGQDGDGAGIFAQRFHENRPPSCKSAIAVPSNLFSNDHAFHVIDIANVSDPDGDAVTLTVDEIYQDERVNARTGGVTVPDGQGVGTNAAEVRDEHLAFGNGRTYRIYFTAEDEWGASCSKAVFVRASPQGKFDADWIIYDSTDIPSINGEFKNATRTQPITPSLDGRLRNLTPSVRAQPIGNLTR